MRKRFLALLLALVMLLAACSTQPDYPKMEMRFRVPGTPAPTYAILTADEWHFSHYTPVSGEWREFIDNTYLAQVEFMNNNYDANWTYTPVEVYGVDLSESPLGFEIGGVFDPNTNCVYLSEKLLEKNPAEVAANELSFIVHEGYHYLQFSNNGSVVFGLVRKDARLGLLFSEAMTNLASMKFLSSIDAEDAAISYMENGYASVTLVCQLLELACPDLMKSFGQGDLAPVQKEFNLLCKAHVKDPREDEFAKLLQSCDLLYEQEKKSQSGLYEAEVMALYHLLQNVEVLAAITESSHEGAFKDFVRSYDILYQGEMFVGEYAAFIDYFSTLHYTVPEI